MDKQSENIMCPATAPSTGMKNRHQSTRRLTDRLRECVASVTDSLGTVEQCLTASVVSVTDPLGRVMRRLTESVVLRV